MNDVVTREWRPPARQRWVSLTGSVVGSLFAGVLAGPVLFVAAATAAELSGVGSFPEEDRDVLTAMSACIAFAVLLTFWLATRSLVLRVSLDRDSLALSGPLWFLRLPRYHLASVTRLGRDGTSGGGVSLGVQQVQLELVGRSPRRVWLEPRHAAELAAALNRAGSPAAALAGAADDAVSAGDDARSTLEVGRGVPTSLVLFALGLLLGGAVRDGLSGAWTGWFSAALLASCAGFLAFVRARAHRAGGLGRWLPVAAFLAGGAVVLALGR